MFFEFSLTTIYYIKNPCLKSNVKMFHIIEKEKFIEGNPRRKNMLELIGDVKGKEILEIGCGNGELSVLLAKDGGNVTSVDISEEAVDHTKKLAEFNGVNLEVYKMDVMDIGSLHKKYDLIVGSYILHHIEPFEKLVEVLYECMKDNGKGVFIENSSKNPILMFSRKYLAGRFGIPKYGDEKEYPLEEREINLLKKKFRNVKVYYPDFIFFRKATTYLFKGNPFSYKITKFMDNLIYLLFPFLRKYSYEQVIEKRDSELYPIFTLKESISLIAGFSFESLSISSCV